MLADVDPAKLLSVVLIAVVVLLAIGIGGLYAIGLSEQGYQEFVELGDRASEAGVSPDCYEAVRDSLTDQRRRVVRHGEVILAVRAIRRDHTGWPDGLTGDAPTCP